MQRRDRLWRRIAAAALALLCPLAAACAPAHEPAEIRYAPYVYVGSDTAAPGLAAAAEATGQKHYTLAFALADDGSCTPSWGENVPLDAVHQDVESLQKLGGDVIVSSGGASGSFLENSCADADALAGAYTKILDTTGSDHLDIDVENGVPADRVNAAVARVQDDRALRVSYTLPVDGDAEGLTAQALALLTDARDRGIDPIVNVMAMNFDPSAEDWGTALTAAVDTVKSQLSRIWPDRSDARLYAMLGVTPMIGVNDTGPATTLADARTLLAYAKRKNLGFLSFWALNRDNGTCPDGTEAAGDCSGISQSAYEFTKLLGSFT